MISYCYSQLRTICIALCYIHQRIKRCLVGYFCRAFQVWKCLCMNKHCLWCSCSKPTLIKYWFWLTCSKIMPIAICPHLNPCMVVITVCPTRNITLSCWNTNTSHSRYSKCWFLTTSSACGIAHTKWRQSTIIRRNIGCLFIAPVVNLKCGLYHCLFILNAINKLSVNPLTALIKILVVNTHAQYICKEQLCRHLFCIWNIRIHIECCLYIGCNHFYIIRYNITRMHICVKVLHADCLVLICAFNPRIYLTLFVRTASHPLFILLFNFFLQRQL